MNTIAEELNCGNNKDITLGMIISRLDQLIESNTKEHNQIVDRLNENDKNIVILKFSRCIFSWLDNKGVIKWAAACCFVFIIDWFTRHYT